MGLCQSLNDCYYETVVERYERMLFEAQERRDYKKKLDEILSTLNSSEYLKNSGEEYEMTERRYYKKKFDEILSTLNSSEFLKKKEEVDVKRNLEKYFHINHKLEVMLVPSHEKLFEFDEDEWIISD
jgi:hypothetical protein